MRPVILAATIGLFLFLSLLGCTNTQPSAQQQQNLQTQTPENLTQTQGVKPILNTTDATITGARKNESSTGDKNNNALVPNDNATAPSGKTAMPISPPEIAANNYCTGKSGAELTNCTINEAIKAKNATMCAALNDKGARNTCITRWCVAVRGYSSCDAFLDDQDRMLCRNKCSPNQLGELQ